MIRKLSEFIIFGSFFIAACAVAMCIETNLLLHLPLNNFSFYAFVFGATLAQYNLHYLVKRKAIESSERFEWSSKHKFIHFVLFIFGGFLIVFSLFSFHINHFLALATMCVISLLYSLPFLPFKKKKRIKDFGLMKIITLALLWTLVTVWFPLVEVEYKVLSFQFIFIRRFMFIFILCLMFDIRDISVDEESGIKTVPVITGLKTSLLICYILLLVFIIISWGEYYFFHDGIQFYTMIISALCTFVLILFGHKERSDYYYLAGIDGMMMLQALIVISGEHFFT